MRNGPAQDATVWVRNSRAAFRKKKLGVVLVRNFLVATYRDPTGIRQKGQKGIYWLLESKNNQPGGGRETAGVGGSGARDTQPGLSPFQPPGLLWVDSPGFSPLTAHSPAPGREGPSTL